MLHLPVIVLFAWALACGDARTSSSQAAATVCASCHGQPPATGAHAVHVAQNQLGCFQCHKDVRNVGDADHILRADGTSVAPPAEVRFDDPKSLASRTLQGASRADAPSYDKSTRTCSNVYCHGAAMNGATPLVVTQPAWDAAPGTISCGKCHGIPPADHPSSLTLADCTTCHGAAIDAAGTPSPQTHVNGNLDFAPNVTSSCASCHGDASSRSATVLPGDPRSAPPTDAEGRPASNPAATSIGAHQNHLVAGVLGVAVACSECHLVPATLLAPSHLDGHVTVTFGPLATKNGTAASYDRSTQTCSNVYCHGDFLGSRATPPPNPTWNGGQAAVACGSCHGLPPPAPGHPDPVSFGVPSGCNGPSNNPALACHPSPYSPTSVDPKLHIDGRVCPPFCTPAAP
jgi:predicted CxxxxCH...CXXCH cytochrome family protein